MTKKVIEEKSLMTRMMNVLAIIFICYAVLYVADVILQFHRKVWATSKFFRNITEFLTGNPNTDMTLFWILFAIISNIIIVFIGVVIDDWFYKKRKNIN